MTAFDTPTAPDARALLRIVAETIGGSRHVGELTADLVVRMVRAAYDGEVGVAFALEDLVRAIHRQHDLHLRRAPFVVGVRRSGAGEFVVRQAVHAGGAQ